MLIDVYNIIIDKHAIHKFLKVVAIKRRLSNSKINLSNYRRLPMCTHFFDKRLSTRGEICPHTYRFI